MNNYQISIWYRDEYHETYELFLSKTIELLFGYNSSEEAILSRPSVHIETSLPRDFLALMIYAVILAQGCFQLLGITDQHISGLWFSWGNLTPHHSHYQAKHNVE